MRGTKTLHDVGRLHGDFKPENVLIFQGEERSLAKISDFGKMRNAPPPGKSLIYQGNHRFMGPERRLTKEEEIYSLGLTVIRIFEEDVLLPEEEMLALPSEVDKSMKPSEKRRGVELFGVLSQKMPHCTEARGSAAGAFRAYAPIILVPEGDPMEAEEEIGRYIDAMTGRLIEGRSMKPRTATHLGKLLKDMTRSDPTKRPTAADVDHRSTRIMSAEFPESVA
ncbi:MAG: protein kinase domain-containing protein, partial [Chlamydiales bacterium]